MSVNESNRYDNKYDDSNECDDNNKYDNNNIIIMIIKTNLNICINH